MATLIDFFDVYTQKLGWKIIPLKNKSKQPALFNWNKQHDLDVIRAYFIANPRSNMGLLLGKIVDVEGDTRAANAQIDNMTKDCPHPIYQSEKSKHHLFINPDKELTRFVIGGIEFRGKGHQSALPPSVNYAGVKYAWLKSTSFPVPPMPKGLLKFYRNYRPINVDEYIRVWCNGCDRIVDIHQKRHKLEAEAFAMNGQSWQCNVCRVLDVRDLCRKIRKDTILIYDRT